MPFALANFKEGLFHGVPQGFENDVPSLRIFADGLIKKMPLGLIVLLPIGLDSLLAGCGGRCRIRLSKHMPASFPAFLLAKLFLPVPSGLLGVMLGQLFLKCFGKGLKYGLSEKDLRDHYPLPLQISGKELDCVLPKGLFR